MNKNYKIIYTISIILMLIYVNLFNKNNILISIFLFFILYIGLCAYMLIYYKSLKKMILSIDFIFSTAFFVYAVPAGICFLLDGNVARINLFEISNTSMQKSLNLYFNINSIYVLYLLFLKNKPNTYKKSDFKINDNILKKINISDVLAVLLTIFFIYDCIKYGSIFSNTYYHTKRSMLKYPNVLNYVYMYMISYCYSYIYIICNNNNFKKYRKKNIFLLIISIFFWGISLLIDRRNFVFLLILVVLVFFNFLKKIKIKYIFITVSSFIFLLLLSFTRMHLKKYQINDLIYYSLGEFVNVNYVTNYYVVNNYELKYGKTYIFNTITSFIPNEIYKNKPNNLAKDFMKLINSNYGLAFNPIAEGLINFGPILIYLFLPLIFIFYTNIAKIISKKYDFLYFIVCAECVNFMRGQFSNSIFFLTIICVCTYIIIISKLNFNIAIDLNKFKEYIKMKLNKNPRIYIIFKKLWKIYYSFILLKCMAFLMRIFPIQNNKIVVCSYYGKGYGDNPKAIIDYILKNEKNKFDIVWLLNDNCCESYLPVGIRRVKYESLSALYELVTAKIWIDNSRKKFMPLKRKKQIYIQTWHAGIGLKKSEKEANNLPDEYIRMAKNDSKNSDLFISCSSWQTNIYKNAFWYNGKILEKGLPRNDILFKKNMHEMIKNKVVNKYNIHNKNIVLYAPTFRNDFSLKYYDIDYLSILKCLKEKFYGDWILLIRFHPNISMTDADFDNDNIINVSDYDDLYELLIASDILISDYSSLIFDFGYLKKPIFLYSSDYELFNKDRGFSFDYFKLPFKVSKNNNELISNIKKFDNKKYVIRLSNFFTKLGLSETGESSKYICDYIIKECFDEKK